MRSVLFSEIQIRAIAKALAVASDMKAAAARAMQNLAEEQNRRMRLEQDLALRTWERDQAKERAEQWERLYYDLRDDRDHALAHVAVNEKDGIALHTRPDSMPIRSDPNARP